MPLTVPSMIAPPLAWIARPAKANVPAWVGAAGSAATRTTPAVEEDAAVPKLVSTVPSASSRSTAATA